MIKISVCPQLRQAAGYLDEDAELTEQEDFALYKAD